MDNIRYSMLPALAVGLATLGGAGRARASGPAVWAEGSALKLRPSSPAGSQGTAVVSGARNEFVSFQIGLNGGASGLSAVTASASVLADGAGHEIPATQVRLYREGLVDITTPSNIEGAPGPWPDPLIPAVDEFDGEVRNAFPFDVPVGETLALWVEIQVPADLPAGSYQGAVSLSGAGGFAAQLPIQLTVWDFSLPSTPSLKTAYLLYVPNVLTAHGLGGSSPTVQPGLALIDRYVRFALDHRISLTNAYTAPELISGVPDFSTFTEDYGAWLTGTAATRLPGARLTSAEYPLPVVSSLYGAWAAYAKRQGFFGETFDYTADEPGYGTPWSAIAPRVQTVTAGDPAFPVLVTTTLDAATSAGVAGLIDWMVPCITSIGTATPQAVREQYQGFLAQAGREFWLYQACVSHGCAGGGTSLGWPQMTIDSAALRTRAMAWIDFAYGATGELYYETAMAFSGSPWTDQYEFGGNGDGTLFYPGTPAWIGGTSQVPVASLRLAQLRDGVQDYEYLTILTSLGAGAEALALAASVVPTANQLGVDPSALYQAREAAGQRIVALLHPAPATTGGSGGGTSSGGSLGGTSGGGSTTGGGLAIDAGSVRGTDGGGDSIDAGWAADGGIASPAPDGGSGGRERTALLWPSPGVEPIHLAPSLWPFRPLRGLLHEPADAGTTSPLATARTPPTLHGHGCSTGDGLPSFAPLIGLGLALAASRRRAKASALQPVDRPAVL